MAAGKPFWNMTANPVNGSTSVRWFYVDETSVIRFETGAAADASSPQARYYPGAHAPDSCSLYGLDLPHMLYFL